MSEEGKPCPRCGHVLSDDSDFCKNCGTEMGAAAEAAAAKSGKKRAGRWIYLVIAISGVLLVAVVLVLMFGRQNINSVYGCPELYDVKFDMSVDEASARIKVEHQYEVLSNLVLASIFPEAERFGIAIEKEANYRVGGLPVEKALCTFSGSGLEDVRFCFSKEEVTYKQVRDFYRKRYGKPSEEKDSEACWNGEKTSILVSDGDEIIVMYEKSW